MLTPAAWPSHLGFIFQTFNLIPVLTARENVELPLQLQGVSDRAERREQAERLLRDLGIPELADRRPAALSGGQQQRVAIARALIKKPTLVLADEPTASLDSETSEEIMALIELIDKEQGTTFVFSTHDPLVTSHPLFAGLLVGADRHHLEADAAITWIWLVMIVAIRPDLLWDAFRKGAAGMLVLLLAVKVATCEAHRLHFHLHRCHL